MKQAALAVNLSVKCGLHPARTLGFPDLQGGHWFSATWSNWRRRKQPSRHSPKQLVGRVRAHSHQPQWDGAVIRWRCQLQAADIRHPCIGFIRSAAFVQRNLQPLANARFLVAQLPELDYQSRRSW